MLDVLMPSFCIVKMNSHQTTIVQLHVQDINQNLSIQFIFKSQTNKS